MVKCVGLFAKGILAVVKFCLVGFWKNPPKQLLSKTKVEEWARVA